MMTMMTPGLVLIPTMGSFGYEMWPTVGAIVAWALIAALVGSGLGLLRHAAPKARARVVRRPAKVVGFTRRDHAVIHHAAA
ncbi:MAG TPA: hypothetical protein VMW17_03275 [Candidatus Binatia bacterium]|nr:hypothetical protein [Candidatus Binatia bacterium]